MDDTALSIRDVLMLLIAVGVGAMSWWLRMLFAKAENNDVQVADLRVKVIEVERDVHKDFATKADLQQSTELLVAKVDRLGVDVTHQLDNIERRISDTR